MSDFKHDEKKGSLFVNSYKTKSNQPDLSGSCTFEGQVYKIAAWENEESEGKKFYYNLRFEEKIDVDVHSHPLGPGFAQKDTKQEDPNDHPGFAQLDGSILNLKDTKREGPNDPGDENDDDLPF